MPVGGTISAKGTKLNYKAGEVSAEELLGSAHIPHNVKIAVDSDPPFTIDSKDLEPQHLFMLRDAILQELEREGRTLHSIVVTHGTCTMELAAEFLDRTLPRKKIEGKTIILVGAMNQANHDKPDGVTNLSHALRLAKRANVSGIMVVMNATGEVFSARNFRKGHTEDVRAFKTVNGPLAAQIRRIPGLNKHFVSIKNAPAAPAKIFNIGNVKELSYVPIIQSQGSIYPKDIIDDIEHKIAEKGARVIVFAGTGMGSVHKEIIKAISEFSKHRDVSFIRATTAGDGEVKHNGGVFIDDLHGTIAAGKLMPTRAALLAQLVMAEAQNQGEELTKDQLRARLREEFGREQTPNEAEGTAAPAA